jgi:hypothetical protein
MATNKPQFNVRLDPAIAEEIEAYCDSSGTIKGKLVERLWQQFTLSGSDGVPSVCANLESYVLRGIQQKDISSFYKLYTALHKALSEKFEETNDN